MELDGGMQINENLEVRKVDLDNLKINPKNPNKHDKRTFDSLRKSIGEYGYIEFIVVTESKEGDEEDFLIIDGAHRAMALEEEGIKTVPVIVAKNISYKEGLLGAYTFNKARGKMEQTTTAQLLMMMKEEEGMSEKEIKQCTGIENDALEEYIGVLQEEESEVLEDGEKTDKEMEQELKKMKADDIEDFDSVVMVDVPVTKYEFVNKTLESISNDEGKALIELCEFWRKHKGDGSE